MERILRYLMASHDRRIVSSCLNCKNNIGLTPRLRQPATCLLDGERIADRLVCDYWEPIEVKNGGIDEKQRSGK